MAKIEPGHNPIMDRRESLNMTQAQLATLAKVSRSAVRRIEGTSKPLALARASTRSAIIHVLSRGDIALAVQLSTEYLQWYSRTTAKPIAEQSPDHTPQ